MKKNYFLTLVAALFMAATASAADNFVGIYKLTNLTADQQEALGSLSPDAAIRIMPGDGEVDYYVSSLAGYGCYLPATYDANKGTLTATANPVLFPGMILLLYSYTGAVAVDDPITFSVTDDALTVVEDIIVQDAMSEDVLGTYAPGVKFTKQVAPTLTVENLQGTYDLVAESVDLIMGVEETVTYKINVSQATGNKLNITGLINGQTISATYHPEVGMISIPVQEVGDYIVAQMAAEFGDVRFTVSDNGEWTLVTPMQAATFDLPLFYFTSATATIDPVGIAKPAAAPSLSISVVNGAICVNSAEPVAVQVYNAAGVQVYANDAANGAITLPRGIYFVKVAGNDKAVSVAL